MYDIKPVRRERRFAAVWAIAGPSNADEEAGGLHGGEAGTAGRVRTGHPVTRLVRSVGSTPKRQDLPMASWAASVALTPGDGDDQAEDMQGAMVEARPEWCIRCTRATR